MCFRLVIFPNFTVSLHSMRCCTLLLRKDTSWMTSPAFLSSWSSQGQNLYEILEISSSASQREVKAAFIRKSKQFHPDRNLSNKEASQKKFVRVLDAYRVLRSPVLRQEYDATLLRTETQRRYQEAPEGRTKNARPRRIVLNPEETKRYQEWLKQNSPEFAQSQHRTEPPVGTPNYYGRGWKRVPNYVLLFFCFTLAFLGGLIHIGTYHSIEDFDPHTMEERPKSSTQSEE